MRLLLDPRRVPEPRVTGCRMSDYRRSSRATHLVAVLCVLAGCTAEQPPPYAVLSTTPDELWRFIEQAVRAELQPLLSKIQSQMDALDSRLESRVDALDSRFEARVDALDSRLVVLDSRVDALTFRLLEDSQTPQLDGLVSRVTSQKLQSDMLTDKVNGQKSLLDGLLAKVDDRTLQMDELAAKVDSQKSDCDELAGRLNRQESQVTEVVIDLDSQQSQLTALSATASSERVRLDSGMNQTASLQARVDQVAARLERVESRGRSDTTVSFPRDCSEVSAGAQSSIHLIQPGTDRSQPPVAAYCDLHKDGGNWTVIQRRANKQPRQDFELGWAAYREGFGELDAEFWWGLDHMWTMTSARDRRYELHVTLEDFDDEARHAVYQGFRVSSEADGYRLTLGTYSGDAGDSLGYHANRKFSTHDRDHDSNSANCAQRYKGAWWYGSCYQSNLNGLYQGNPASDENGIAWQAWRGTTYSMRSVEMKIRPRTT